MVLSKRHSGQSESPNLTDTFNKRQCRLRSILKWDDEIEIRVSIKNIGTSSFTFSVKDFCAKPPRFLLISLRYV